MLAPILVLLLFAVSSDANGKNAKSGGHWNHDNNGRDWIDKCQTGRQQSPIHLRTKSASKHHLPSLELVNYGHAFSSAPTVYNKGYTVSIKMESAVGKDKPYMFGSALNGNYIAEELHFHWGKGKCTGSEHIIDDKLFDIEMHIVHRSENFESLEDAIGKPKGIAVLGVLINLDKNEDQNGLMHDLFKSLPEVIKYHEKRNVQFDLGAVINALNLEKYFTYQGSLTTPTCDEYLTWIVLRHPISISYKDAANLWQLENAQGKKITNNYRAIQKLNSRRVIYNT